MHIRKDDQVIIISGNDRGKTGKVLKTYPAQKRVVIEGINFIKRHTRPTQTNPQGGIIEREGPIHISNVMVICPKCGEGVRTHSIEVAGSDGKMRHVRACVKCGEMVGGEG
jgi:large subunit ribosomal protein L24